MDKLYKYFVLLLMAVIVALAGYGYFKFKSYEKQIVKLQNEMAKKDETIQVQAGLYAKLTQQMDDAKLAIDATTEEGKKLNAELKKTKAEVLTVQNTVIKLKTVVAEGKAVQDNVPTQPNGEPMRKKVSFAQDFGFASVTGFTLTDPPMYHLELGQGSKPLKLMTVVAQQPDGSWKSYVSSSDSNVAVDIGVAAVNPYILEPSWYEKIKVHLDLGVGSAILAGVGASYQFGQFDVGPTLWYTTLKDKDQNYVGGTAFGVNFSWAPFKSTKP